MTSFRNILVIELSWKRQLLMPIYVTLMHHMGHQHQAKKAFALAFGTATVPVSQQESDI
jgi:hypothetical protein